MVDMRFVVACLLLLVHYSCGTLTVGNTTVKCRVKERLSLLSLKRGFVDPDGCLASWGSSENHTDCCTWHGVSCDSRTGHVDALDLSGCDLEGTISPSLAKLHHLTNLDLSFQNFSPAKFPDSILSLKRLQYLDLSFTNLTGNIPPNLGYLSRLQTLRLKENQLEGGIPKSLALCHLTELDLSQNSLSGQLDDFVASFNHCANTSLLILDLSYNRFTGSVPNFSRFSLLEILSLSNNQLNGTVNDGIGLLSKLTELELATNFLHGVITETHFSRLSLLESLDLSLNNLEFKVSPDWIPPFQLWNINLRSCKLGPGFPNWLLTQKWGWSLDISNAEISGMMPSWFWNISFLYVKLSHNQMTGEIQNFQLKNGCPALTLDLSSNLFKGSIPSKLSDGALALFLSDNKFTDASTFLCPNETLHLKILHLSNNQLSGMLPNCWKYFKSLAFLDVANNSLYGEIPTSMGSLINIQSLHLGFNKFSGEIPFSLHRCTKLAVFDAVGNDFSGLVPHWIGDGLRELSVLILRSNMFFGSLPLNICNLRQLQILDLSMNNISGSLPKCLNHLSALKNQTNFDEIWYAFAKRSLDDIPVLSSKEDIATLVWKGKMSKYQSILRLVKSIDLSCNMLMGEIPSELMDLVELVALNISRNMLSGQIPATIGQLKSLDFLDLSRNHLSGHIPSELSQVDRLGVMDLSHNNLSGEIPHGTQLQSFDPSAYEGNAHLCGAPLPKCPTSPTQDHPNDEDSEEDEQIFCRGFFISSSIGFGTGFWGICSLIFLNKSFRYAYFRLMSGIQDKVYVIVAVNVAKLRRWRRGSI
ncbi:receptor-like protein EIX2 [Neltuma alba]|uniref:receptor-like protein EIX2 n=1 Tax=Neltuma alba TaxID=207710 RepID=UPI0010A3BAFF|nr:receptor-like protein EIX2 [Prosopis alba]